MPKLIPHDHVSETFVCRSCMTMIDPVGSEYEDYTKDECDSGVCPLCRGTDTAWLFQEDTPAMRFTLLLLGPDDTSTYPECWGSTATSNGRPGGSAETLADLKLPGHTNWHVHDKETGQFLTAAETSAFAEEEPSS